MTSPRRKTVGMRSTRQRAAVEDCLSSLTRFASASEIHRIVQARGNSVGLTTVYRTLQALAEAHLVDVLNSPSGETLYRKCHSQSHHHHLVCTVCGATVEILAEPVEKWAKEAAEQNGYLSTGHTAEVFGICPRCRLETTIIPGHTHSDH